MCWGKETRVIAVGKLYRGEHLAHVCSNVLNGFDTIELQSGYTRQQHGKGSNEHTHKRFHDWGNVLMTHLERLTKHRLPYTFNMPLALAPEDTYYATLAEKSCTIWSLTHTPRQQMQLMHTREIHYVQWHPHAEKLLVADWQCIAIWSTRAWFYSARYMV
jgi:hypothetical protein